MDAKTSSGKLSATSPYSHDGSVKEGAIDGSKKYKFMLMGFAADKTGREYQGYSSGWFDVKISGAATLAAASLVASAALLFWAWGAFE